MPPDDVAQRAASPPATARDLVMALGGPNALAERLAISAPAICNWYLRGIPSRHHLALWQLARAAGIAWTPPRAENLALLRTAPGPSAGRVPA